MTAPNVTRAEYALIDVDDGQVSLQDDAGEIREDLSLPKDRELSEKIKKEFEGGKDMMVTVVGAMGEESIMSCKENNK